MIDVPGIQHEQPGPPGGSNHRTIPATCNLHGAIGYTNFVVTRRDGGIEFNPHVAGSCVITLDEDGACVLFDALGEWFG